MIPLLRALTRKTERGPAYYGHIVHAWLGEAWLRVPLMPLEMLVPVLLVFSIVWEIDDDDYRTWFWNGAADTMAFWPWALLALSWQWSLGTFALYLVALHFEGRRYPDAPA